MRGRSLSDALKTAADAGARLFQYRDKTASMRDAYRIGQELREAATAVGATLIVNDRTDLALAIDADGVHLGQRDLPVADARALLGAGRLIGLSTHTADQVREGSQSGADYLGFGPIFMPGSKTDHEPEVGIEGLRTVRPLSRLPIIAIGGLDEDSVGPCLQAGADGVAVISAIWRADDPGAAVRRLLTRIEAGRRAR